MKKICIFLVTFFTPSLGSAQTTKSRSSIEIYAYGSIDPLKGLISLKFVSGAHNKATVIETLFKPTSILTVQEDTAGKEKICFPSTLLKLEYEEAMGQIAKNLSPKLRKNAKLIFGILTTGEINIEPFITEIKT